MNIHDNKDMNGEFDDILKNPHDAFLQLQNDFFNQLNQIAVEESADNISVIKQIEEESRSVFDMIGQYQNYIQSGTRPKTDLTDYLLEKMPINRYEVTLVNAPLEKNQERYQMNSEGTVLLIGDASQELKKWIISKGLKPVEIPVNVNEADMMTYFTDSFVGIIGITKKEWTEQESYGFVKLMSFAGKHTANIWFKKRMDAFFVVVTKLGGRFGINSIEKDFVTGSLSGLCKSAAIEWDNLISVHYIDVKAEAGNAEIVHHIDEELRFGQEIQVGYPEKDQRVILGLNERYETQIDNKMQPSEDDVFLVAGGAEGVTAACIIELAKRFHSKFILCGMNDYEEEYVDCYEGMNQEEMRQAILNEYKSRGEHIAFLKVDRMVAHILSQRHMHETMQQLESLGCDAVYYQCDINNKAEVHEMVQRGEQKFGRITGIIHGAGVLVNSLLYSKTEEVFKKVFSVKYNGTNNMVSEIDSEHLKYLCFFSSVSGFFGSFGQTDYSCGNEYLNNYARYYKTMHPECKVMSLNWGPWDGGMIDKALKSALLRRGRTLIDLEIGKKFFVDAFIKILDESNCQLVISDLDNFDLDNFD